LKALANFAIIKQLLTYKNETNLQSKQKKTIEDPRLFRENVFFGWSKCYKKTAAQGS